MFYDKTITENGITVLTESMPNVRSAAIGIWIGAGARDEPRSISGMSHFLEHLMFKGTKKRSAKEISEAFESMGAELNAFTSKELTAFYSRLLDENLEEGVEILADMLQNATFKEQDIESERQVVMEEISLHEDSPDEIIHDLFSDTLFSKHPLGKRILGNSKTVADFNHEKLINFYNKTYVPKNIVIAGAGSLKHEKLLALVNKFFKMPSNVQFKREEKKTKSGSQMIASKKDSEQSHVCLGALSLSATDKDRFILSVLDNILGGGMSSRLFQEVREKRGLAYAVFTYHSVHTETGSFCLYAGTSPKNTEQVYKIFREEIEKIRTDEVPEKELKRAKEHIKGQLVLGLESTTHRMMRLGKSALTHGNIYSVNELINKIDIVDAKQIKELANRLLKDDALNLALVGPFGDKSLEKYDFENKILLNT
ncbi:MAG: insulinase family protein [Actinobacteria bacterium]|nr:MAG: insulinase family protein [Actinomycetota bacterium]